MNVPRAGRYYRICISSNHTCDFTEYGVEVADPNKEWSSNDSGVGLVVNGTPKEHQR